VSSNKLIIIGGSAGSFSVVTNILAEIPKNFKTPIVLVLHRLKHVRTGFAEALSIKSALPVTEPFDKERIENGRIYIAPANYHLLIEAHKYFSLSTEEAVNHSRPSIDMSFVSAASVFKENTIGIILSGANNDGAYGMKRVHDYGGEVLIQNPDECQVSTMPVSCLKLIKTDKVYTTAQIIDYIKSVQ
jgi:two-component system, chemotaxis family, protein-glutamate methylesterase/glutaminase